MDWKSFKFEYRLNTADMLPNFIEIEAYKEAALNLILPPDWKEQLDKLNRVRAVYGTTALEGNPLSEEEVSRQLDKFDAEGLQAGSEKMTKEKLQIRNAGKAQQWVKERFLPGGPPVSLDDILEMHRMITEKSDTNHNIPGRLRTFSVQVGSPDLGGVHIGAPHKQLARLMEEYIQFINSRKLKDQHPVVKALLAHFFLVTIHPFGDGNGRVSRLVEAGILFQQGHNVHGFYGLSNHFYQNDRKYKTLLQQCRAKEPFDVTHFVRFGIEGFRSELKGINNFIKTKMNRIVYKNMLVRSFNQRVGSRRRLLNQREYNLLDFLLTETEPTDPFSDNPSAQVRFSKLLEAKYIQTAYRNVTQRTFHRELTRLRELGFITLDREEENKDWVLEINFAAIGMY